MSIYDEMQQVAREVIGEFKQGTVSYIHSTKGNGPTHNPGPPQLVPHAIDAVARGVKFKYVDGTNIVATDLQVTMPVMEGVPTPAMPGFVDVDAVRHKIVSVKPIPPAGTPVAHVLIFRK